MKKLFAILFSFQLMVAPVVYANTPGAPEDAFTAEGSEAADGRMGTGSKGGYDFYVKQVMMLASGIMGANLIKCTAVSYTWSHYVFMAGALTLLASEIIGAKNEMNYNSRKMEELKLKDENLTAPEGEVPAELASNQTKMFKSLLEKEEKNKEFIEKRMKWMTAVQVLYYAAAASALVEVLLYALTKVPYTAWIGYTDWTLNCNSAGNEQLVMAVAAAYSVLPSVINDPKAGLMKAGSIGISMVAMFKTLKTITNTVGKQIGNAVKTAPGRAIVFGAFGALATTVWTGLNKRKKIAAENIEKIKKIKVKWEEASGGGTVAGVASGAGGGIEDTSRNVIAQDPHARGAIKMLPKGEKPKSNCFGGDSKSGISYSSSNCRNTYKFSRKMPDFKIPTLSKAINTGYDMTEALARGDMGTAEMHQGNLNANAAKIMDIHEDLQTQANEKLKSIGEKPVDFKAKTKEFLADFANSSQSAGAAFGLGAANGKVDLAEATTEEATPVPEVKMAATNASAPVVGDGTLDLSAFDSEPAVDENLGAVTNEPTDSLDNYESTVEDISKKSDVSIFKQLSNRYILNYTRMFERQKEPEVVDEAPKN